MARSVPSPVLFSPRFACFGWRNDRGTDHHVPARHRDLFICPVYFHLCRKTPSTAAVSWNSENLRVQVCFVCIQRNTKLKDALLARCTHLVWAVISFLRCTLPESTQARRRSICRFRNDYRSDLQDLARTNSALPGLACGKSFHLLSRRPWRSD